MRLAAASLSLLVVLLAHVPASAQSRPQSFPTFGLSFVPPAAAQFELTPSPSHVGLYRFNDRSPAHGAAILIEAAPAPKGSLDERAKSLVDNAGAKLEPGAYNIGGERAVKLSADFDLQSFTHRTSYLVHHDGREYIFSEMTAPGSDASKPLDALLKSVKFFPPDSPTKHLGEFSDQPITVFDTFTINCPRCLRIMDEDPKKLLALTIYDFTTNSSPMDVNIQSIELPVNKTFADVRDVFSSRLQQQLNSSEALVWHQQKGLPALNVSQPIHSRIKLPDGPEVEATSRFCMLELGGGKFVQIVFSIPAAPDAQVKAYVAASERMLGTVKLLPSQSGQH